MGGTSLSILTRDLTLEKKQKLAIPLANAFIKSLKNVGLTEVKEIAKDKAWGIFLSYFGRAGEMYELASAFISGEEGEFKGKIIDYLLGFAGLDQYKEAYDILVKIDNGRTAMALAKDPAFKDIIGKLD
jgi:hypothetical protein